MALTVIFMLYNISVQAGNAELNETLVRIIHQINAIKPLLVEARKEINPNDRIQLHIDKFYGPDGKNHSGLSDDLFSIRNGLIAYINHPVIAPRKIPALALDFMNTP